MRRGGTLVAALLALAACTPGGAAKDGPAAPGSGLTSSARLLPQCAPPPARRPIEGAKVANDIVAGADLPLWRAADIGASVQLSDRRIVWVFGDTLRDADRTPRIVAKSMLVSSGECLSQVVPAAGGAVMPFAGPVLWPMSAVVLRVGPDQDELVVLCSRIRRGTGAYAFTFLGTSAAIFDVGRLGVPRLREVREITPDDPDTHQVNWGAAATVHENWLYVYGTRLGSGTFGRSLHVSRVPLDDPGNRSAWRFWDGGDWVPAPDRAAPVLPAAGGVSQTLSVDVVGGSFVAVSKRDGDLLVSISRNTTDLGALVRDPERGRPRFVQIPPPS
jgi:hypothetical protein